MPTDHVATLSLGQIKGRQNQLGALEFLGVPYAQPPIGPLRFAPPRELEHWEGLRPALETAPASMQADSVLGRVRPQGEACLWMNLWTPSLDREARRPVMLFIHGGASNFSPNDPLLNGARLCQQGDVVVCVVSWRLGALGLLRVPGMDQVNLGLRDWCAALRFLRREAAAFGGDPDNITLFGESSGGSAVASLLVSPLARGLFDRAIVQSPGPWYPHNLPDSAEALKTELFAKALGLPSPEKLSLERLRQLPASQILAAQARAEAVMTIDLGSLTRTALRTLGYKLAPRLVQAPALAIPFQLHQSWRQPTTDRVTLSEAAPVGSCAHPSVPLMVGCTADEWGAFVAMGFGAPSRREEVAELAARQVPPGRSFAAERRAAAEELLEAYLGRSGDLGAAYKALMSDLIFVAPTHQLAASHASANPGKTFVYQFRYGYLTRGPLHMVDVPMTFGNHERHQRGPFKLPPDAAEVSERMMEVWATFARRGDPSNETTGEWRPYLATEGERRAMVLDRECHQVDADQEVLSLRLEHERIFRLLGEPHRFCDLPRGELLPW